MKKFLLITITQLMMVIVLTACGNNSTGDDSSKNEDNTPDTLFEAGTGEENTDIDTDMLATDGAYESEQVEANKHYYRTVRLKADNSYDLIINLPFESSKLGDYYPTLTFTYNTETGKIERAEYSTYFWYYPGEDTDVFLQEVTDIISSGEGICTKFSNVRTENMDDVTKLTFDIDISSYFANFDQYVNLCFVEGEQDIEKYKNSVYYDVLYNQSDPIPSCEDRDGYFYDEITRRQVEWED